MITDLIRRISRKYYDLETKLSEVFKVLIKVEVAANGTMP